MLDNRSAAVSLFELLAREWTFDAEVVQVGFNQDESAALFLLSSGKLSVVPTKDPESPKSRTRVAIDTGQTTIKPRKKPIAAAILVPINANADIPVVHCGPEDFIALDSTGTPHQITAQGQCVVANFNKINNSRITALCSNPIGDRLAIARYSDVSIYETNDAHALIEFNLNHPINCMSFSETGTTLAVWGEDCLTLLDTQNPDDSPTKFQGMNHVTQITWNRRESHLACASSSHSFCIVDIHNGRFHRVENYPAPVSNATFSETGNALVTSGAYRLTGWSIDDLPQKNHPGTPLTTGKPGLIVIKAIAAHPTRNLVAAGYTNGLVIITSIGTPQEMMVHEEPGTEINQLAWSISGEHLAIGFKSGKAAVVTFPEQIFK